MRLQWAANYDGIGNAFGYTTHQRNLKAGLERAGVVMDNDADIAVSIITPDYYDPVPGKFNVLYTMYECTSLPPHWGANLNKADLIVVPCTHNKKLFRNYTDLPIEVCWEGVDVKYYRYVKREFPNDRPFTFLWVGASNPRKGYEHVVMAWKVFKDRHPELAGKVKLIMKTTQVTRDERVVNVGGDAFVDTRRLPFESKEGIPSMWELYAYAHAFLLPSMGEGFGLTLAEAMSTGLPCIYTPWSGPVDFISHREGYPVKWHFAPIRTKGVTPEGVLKVIHESKAASADPMDIVNQMERIYYEYEYALKKGVRAAGRIRRDITWDKSAASFIEIMRKYWPEEAAA